MSKRNKFDLTALVHHGLVAEGETLFFVSDPSKTCVVHKMPNHEFKVRIAKEVMTVHACAQGFLGTEPPEHASRWLRNAKGKTLYELWQYDISDEREAA